MKNQLLSCLLIVLMTMVGAKVSAEEVSITDHYLVTLKYRLENSEAVVIGCKNTFYEKVRIPYSFRYKGNDYTVTSIGESAFANRSLGSVEIPSSVKSIGKYAFEGCGLTSITFPSDLNTIDETAFKDCSRLPSINVSVNDLSSFCNNTLIGKLQSLFGKSVTLLYNSFPMQSFVVPEDVTTIGDEAFRNCSGLTSVVIPNSVTSIGDAAFNGCSGLTSVTIGNSVTSIGNNAFSGCSGLTSVTIGNSVTSIGYAAFSGCSSLKVVRIPDSVTSIGYLAFNGCSGLTSVTIGNSVTSIDFWAFSGCTSLKVVRIPDSVTSIGHHAFYGCSGLTSVNIPNSLTSIVKSVFEGCSDISSLTIPYNFRSISAFKDCSNLTNIKVRVSNLSSFCNNTLIGEINSLFGKSVTLIDNDGKVIVNFVVPEDVTTIGDRVFCNCGLNSVDIPNSVTSIGKYAFEGCDLPSITFPSNLNTIDETAFIGCSKLSYIKVRVNDLSTFWSNKVIGQIYSTIGKTVTLIDVNGKIIQEYVIPNDATTVEENAFRNCSGLVSVTIGNGVKSISNNAFTGTNLKKCIWLTNTPPSGFSNLNGDINYVPNDQYSSLKNTVVYQYLSSMFEVGGVKYVPVSPSERTCDAIDCVYNESSTEIEIPSKVKYKNIEFTVKNIQKYLAKGNNFIETLKIDNEGEVPDYAFLECDNLTTVTLGNKITTIGRGAFKGCSRLTSLTIWDNVTSIGKDGALFGSSDIKVKVTVSDLLTICNNKIMSLIYNNMQSSMRSISPPITLIDKNGDEIEELVIPEGATSIGDSAFINCVGLTSISFSNSVTSIGERAFLFCVGLTSISFSNSVKSIGESAFRGCRGLTSVSIPNSVTSIGKEVFSGCRGLTSVSIPNSVTSIGKEAFFVCSGLTSVSIPNSVTNIGDFAFYGCSSLTSVTIGNSVKSIGISAFYGCSLLNELILGSQVNEIKSNAFQECKKMPTIIIPKSVISIGNNVFLGCENLKKVVISDREETLELGSNGNNPMFASCPLDEIYIGGNISYPTTSDRGYSPFYGNSTLRVVHISDKKINENEFSGCSNLQIVAIGESVTTIGNRAFENCTALKDIIIPKSVTSIKDYSFSGCTSLKKVVVADRDKILTLGSDGSYPLFSSCQLDEVYIGGKISYNTSSSCGYSPFYGNTTLRTIKIADKETEISTNEFYGCTNLQNVSIGDDIATIGDWAFSGCTNLKKFEFGTKLKSIGQEAFSDCISLNQLISKAQTPPVCGSQALSDINKWECTLFVPEGALAAYQSADQWKDFFFVEEGAGAVKLGDVDSDGEITKKDVDDIIRFIMGENPENFNKEAADLNGDEKIDVADVVVLNNLLKEQ